MGESPVAHVADPNAGPGDIYPWQAGLLDDSTGLAVTSAQDIPFEQLAALDPDLILVTYLAEDQAIYDRLNSIAPTIGLLGDRQVDRWQDMITVAGQFLGRPAQADEIVAGVDDVMADAAPSTRASRARRSRWPTSSPATRSTSSPTRRTAPASSSSSSGWSLDPDVLAAADGVSGRRQLQLRAGAALLDGDLLVLFSNGDDPSDLVGYDQLAVVAGRRVGRRSTTPRRRVQHADAAVDPVLARGRPAAAGRAAGGAS